MKIQALLLGAALALAGCTPPAGSHPVDQAHYMVGKPYRIGAAWRYPREQFDYDATGLATTDARADGLTADGEAVDPQGMTAAHPTLQLPAVVRVTNLDDGNQVVVRVNDRGPANPGRIIALSPRAMALLRPADPHAVRVRVQVMQAESLQLAADLGGAEAPHLALAVVPLGEVTSQALPPPGAAAAPQVPQAGARTLPRVAPAAAAPVPLRLPATVAHTAPRPGSLYVEVASFGHAADAVLLQRRLASLGADVVLDYNAPRERDYRVRIGPLAGAAAADATLARVIAAGLGDAHIAAE